MIKFLLFVLVWLGGLDSAHKFYVSICQLEFDSERKVFEIGQGIFIDDLEKVLSKANGDIFIDVRTIPDDSLNRLLENYLGDKITLRANGRPSEINFIGFERGPVVVWCFLESNKIKKIQNMEFGNSVLMEMFEQQEIIVNLKIDDFSKSYRLKHDEPYFRWHSN